MSDIVEQVRNLRRQQAAVAGFGSFALRQSNLSRVLTEAARVCAESLRVPFCKVCRYRSEENDLLIEAGYGWHAGVVGHVASRADESTPQGRALVTGRPLICYDLRKENDFDLPPHYVEHGIISTINVVIRGDDRTYGVLEIDNDVQHNYDQHDVDFLIGFANVIAEAVATNARTAFLQATIEQMKALVEEKDRLLQQKKMLAEELQHRVRNNLQLVYGMLSKQLDDTNDELGQRGIKAIARRVRTLAQVYDHLHGDEMTRAIDFGSYLESLCFNIARIQRVADDAITLTCNSDPINLDLDVVTALGIVVGELVTNCYDHAFPNAKGSIIVSLRRDTGDDGMAVMTIKDNGIGFKPVAKSKRQGIGLVFRLIEQVRGTAAVDSDHGTTWIIRFPIADVGERQVSGSTTEPAAD
ncbi:MAG TPA: histidine kinase dimerization/phosphoacceptor domain -containing protein [Acetobacteraceae bacterium]|jgi:two-component sensor histidine kinase|nr:histidine kinase dimerization/phosphoacceptor domain -containing protein [Acetobacteraceae bacterium]